MQEFVSEFGVDGFDHVVDQSAEVWAHFGVFVQPSFAFVDAGGDVEVFVGAMGAEALSTRIDELVDGE